MFKILQVFVIIISSENQVRELFYLGKNEIQ